MNEKLSRRLSFILRHKPESIGIELDGCGWANVKKLINKLNISMEVLEEIVNTDNKQRYSFNETKTKIRANQGHSIQVNVDLKELCPPETLYHGTGEKYLGSILEKGLIKKSRLYVHLSSDVETAIAVGKRHGEEVVLIVNARQMFKDGYEFYLSANNVWLTDHVPTKYISFFSKNVIKDKNL